MSKGKEYSRLFASTKIFLIGLIILFSCSLPTLKGKKTPELYTQLGPLPLSSEEKLAIDNAYLQSGDRGEITKYQRYWYKFKDHTLLKRIFPAVQFHKLNSGISVPETQYIMAYRNGKFYDLPSGFNRLLLDNGLKVTDKNIIELAKAFVVIAMMDNPPIDYSKPDWEDNIDKPFSITFLEGKRIKEYEIEKHPQYIEKKEIIAQIKCRFDNGEIQIWKFYRSIIEGQFEEVIIFINNKAVHAYYIKLVEK